MAKKRDMKRARTKVEAENTRCRVCLRPGAEAAHIIARSTVKPGIGEHPDNIVPLCGPATSSYSHHGLYDSHRLDLLPYLKQREYQYAVGLVGEARAFERVTGRSFFGEC